MTTARRLFAAAIVAACAAAARAEVSVETDVFGTYLRTVVSSNTSVRALRIWSVSRVRPTHWPVNPAGDSNGDLWPYVAENPVQGRWPWIAWSRFNGTDYDLAWSRWTGRGWTSVASVEATPGPDDALDPAITFDREGRAYVVWVSRAPSGASKIYVSMFLVARWTAPFQISDAAEDASEPSVTVLADGTIEVTYATPVGQVTRTLQVSRPWTITDDITPFGTLTDPDPWPGAGR